MNQKEMEGYVKAGDIAWQIRGYAEGFIKRGMKLLEIAERIDRKIEELGVKPAFPINLSLNEIAAHYTPSIEDETVAEGILKIDIGVEVHGFIADLAFSLDLTEEKKYGEMIELNRKILEKTIASLNYDSSVSDIGNKLSDLLEGNKLSIIKNLNGHSLGKYEIHSELSIPNIANNDKTPLKEKAFAIEPFLTSGLGEVIEGKPSEIFVLIGDKKIRDNEARKILEYIKAEYKTKPFCKRWLDKKGFKTNFAMKLLVKEGIIHNFPILIEKSKSPVSQFEETIIFYKGKKIITTNQSANF